MIYAVKSEIGVTTEGKPNRMPDQPMQGWFKKWHDAGRVDRLEDWMMETFPSEVRVSHAGLTDVVIFGFLGIPNPVRDVIEQFEPCVHQFIPFDLIIGSGKDQEVREYSTLIIGQFADLANLELSDLRWRKVQVGPNQTIDSWSKRPGVPLTLEREKTGNLNLWHTHKHKAMTCMSDQLYQAIKEVCPMTGLQF